MDRKYHKCYLKFKKKKKKEVKIISHPQVSKGVAKCCNLAVIYFLIVFQG